MCEVKNTMTQLEAAIKVNPSILKGVQALINKYDGAAAPNSYAHVKNNITSSNTLNALIVFCQNCDLQNELTLKNTVSYKCRHCDWENRLSKMQMAHMKTL
jgi:hypothetical protein